MGHVQPCGVLGSRKEGYEWELVEVEFTVVGYVGEKIIENWFIAFCGNFEYTYCTKDLARMVLVKGFE